MGKPDPTSEKITLARKRLTHLADVVQKRLVSQDFLDDPLDHAIRLRASELDLKTCWEILQKFDPNALEWLQTSRVYALVMNRHAEAGSPKLISPKPASRPGGTSLEEEKTPESPKDVQGLTEAKVSWGDDSEGDW